MATITWNPADGGSWTDAADWIGGVAPGTADTAVIAFPTDAPGFVGIDAGTSIEIANVVLQGGADLDVSGTLDITDAATLEGGHLEVSAGGVLSGTFDLAGGELLASYEGNSTGTLDGVTLLGTSEASDSFDVVGGLSILSPTADLTGSTLDFLGSQTLSGDVVIQGAETLSATGTLTIAAGTTIDNAGTILSLLADSYTSAPNGTFVNDGAIMASVLSLSANLTNNGTITLSGTLPTNEFSFFDYNLFDNAGTLLVTGGNTLSVSDITSTSAFENSGLIEIGNGSTLSTIATLDNAVGASSGTISLDAGSVFQPGAAVTGGTILSSSGTISSPYGPLDDMLIAGTVTILGLLEGDGLTFAPTADAGSAVITLAPHDQGDGGEILDSGTLTLSAGTALSFATTSDIDTTPQTTFVLSAASLSLGGVIGAVPGGTLSLRAGTFNSDSQLVPGPISNTGTILTAAGETLLLTGDTLAGAGSLSLASGATLDLDVAITAAVLEGLVSNGGTVVLENTLDVGSLTITLDPSSILANVTLSNSAVLLGGTYVSAGLALALNGTLSDTAWRGELDLSNAATVAVENGLSVTGTAGGPGLISMPGTVNVLDFVTDTTLDNITIAAGSTIANPASTDVSALYAGTSTELALGPSADVTFAGDLPTAGIIATGSVSNAGTVTFAGTSSGGGGNIESMLGTTLDNTGVISVVDNAVLFYASDGLPPTTFADIGQFAPVALFTNGITGLLSGPAQPLSSQVQTDAIDFQGTVSGNGTILVGAGGVAFVNDAVAATQTIAFRSTNAIVAMLNPSAVAAQIVGFGVGDALDLTLAAFAGGALSYSNGTLNIPVASGTVDLTVALANGVTASQLVLAEDAVGGTVVYVACFAEGTCIATPRGPIPVERLCAGDIVRTASGSARPIVWTGHRGFAPRRHPRPHDVQPVRIAAGAFARGVPSRTLRLSPDHAVFVGGALIPARYLVNGASVAQEDVASVAYWHVELSSHDVLLAEGLACESFLDTGNRGAFAGEAATDLHPDFARDVWARDACAPLALSGLIVQRARARLIGRLPALGYVLTDDPLLRLFADGTVCSPRRAGDWVRLLLPAGRQTLDLHSRVGVPAHLDPANDDTRRLGVALVEVRLDGAPVPRADPRLAAGWHAVEPDLRWTDGDARLDLAGARLVELRFAPGLLRYAEGEAYSTRNTTNHA